MRSDTNFFARDAQGLKLVVGQTVYATHHKRTGQLMGVTHPHQVCLVRFLDNGEVASIPAAQLKIAGWSTPSPVDRAIASERPRASATNTDVKD